MSTSGDPRSGGTVRELHGKVAVVTGGASGIGLAMVQRFAAGGHDRRRGRRARATPPRTRSAKLRADGLDAVHAAVVDVTDYDSVAELAGARARPSTARVHVLCNNAGVGSGAEGFIWEHELADWRWGFDVNVWGVDPRHQGVRPGHGRRPASPATS